MKRHVHSTQAWHRNSVIGRLIWVRNNIANMMKDPTLTRSEQLKLEFIKKDLDVLLDKKDKSWTKWKKKHWKK